MDKNLFEKLADEHIKFLNSPTWALIKFKFSEYQRRQQEYTVNYIRSENWHAVARLQGMVDGIIEAIKMTERLDSDIKNGTLDVDVALRVIENK
jgi:glutamate/tyrosine decarboxylase-like PLP-dependent enzyme